MSIRKHVKAGRFSRVIEHQKVADDKNDKLYRRGRLEAEMQKRTKVQLLQECKEKGVELPKGALKEVVIECLAQWEVDHVA